MVTKQPHRYQISRVIPVLGLLGGVCLLVGCQQGRWRYPYPLSDEWSYLLAQPGPGVVSVEQPLIPDVGQPIGFVPLVKQSESSLRGDARQVKHVYQGRASLSDVIDFYTRYPQAHGWHKLNQTNKPDGVTLNFTKGIEKLRILLYAEGDRVTVVLMIGQRHTPPSLTDVGASSMPIPNLKLGDVH